MGLYDGRLESLVLHSPWDPISDGERGWLRAEVRVQLWRIRCACEVHLAGRVQVQGASPQSRLRLCQSLIQRGRTQPGDRHWPVRIQRTRSKAKEDEESTTERRHVPSTHLGRHMRRESPCDRAHTRTGLVRAICRRPDARDRRSPGRPCCLDHQTARTDVDTGAARLGAGHT